MTQGIPLKIDRRQHTVGLHFVYPSFTQALKRLFVKRLFQAETFLMQMYKEVERNLGPCVS